MKTEKLFEILTLVDGIRHKKWSTVRQLVDLIAAGSVTIKEKNGMIVLGKRTQITIL